MKLSIVICTWNRVPALSATLASLADISPPGCAWEVIVVSNDCSTATAEVARAFLGRLPLRLVEEPVGGLSHARNRGISEATGDYILWTDDDVLFDKGWLQAYERAFREWPEAAFFGGTILPLLEGNPPDWLKAALPFIDNVYAARRPKEDLGPIRSPSGDLPFGANYVVRSAEQRQYPYNAALGRQPGGTVMNGEETEVLRKLLSVGHTGAWVPGAVVHHVMPPERQTLAYLWQYFEGCGWRAAAMRSRDRSAMGRRVWYRLRAARYAAWFRLLFATAAPPVWVEAMKRAAVVSGRARYHAAKARSSGRAGLSPATPVTS